MDDRLSAWEERLSRELDQAVREVRAPAGLAAAARAGGRRRLSRRRALVAVPAVVAAAGGAVWAGTSGPAPQATTPAAPSPATPSTTPSTAPRTPVPPADPQAGKPAEEMAAVDRFYEQYRYSDAERLAGVWNVDTWEAKVKGGRLLLSGGEIPAAP
ncbi:hypothetical protein AB2L27_01210 [Kineococcus sp. LSe6-4]|uniref:Uncharacterized protein n=1 Tax=Kineococcus halophytocola TaxID=3234027 RepID=A0ABV4GVQ6_9ACTN